MRERGRAEIDALFVELIKDYRILLRDLHLVPTAVLNRRPQSLSNVKIPGNLNDQSAPERHPRPAFASMRPTEGTCADVTAP